MRRRHVVHADISSLGMITTVLSGEWVWYGGGAGCADHHPRSPRLAGSEAASVGVEVTASRFDPLDLHNLDLHVLHLLTFLGTMAHPLWPRRCSPAENGQLGAVRHGPLIS